MYENQEFLIKTLMFNEIINVCKSRVIPIVMGCFIKINIILKLTINNEIIVIQKIVY